MTNQANELLFVYGTLMSGQRAGAYLDGCMLLGRYYLSDYAMHDLGPYPAIVPQKGGLVTGELYRVTSERLHSMDDYECEGTLYHRKRVTVWRQGPGLEPDIHIVPRENVNVYVYAHPEELPGEPMLKPWGDYGTERVWYAAYGSNLKAKRFVRYIKGGVCEDNDSTYRGCTDKTLPPECCVRTFPGRMYFAKSSRNWENGGVAFYNPEQSGETYMRLYSVSRAQLDEIQDQEGPETWYARLLKLGVHEDGRLIYTITSVGAFPHTKPGKKYRTLIRTALIKECKVDEAKADVYLEDCVNRPENPEEARESRTWGEFYSRLTSDQLMEWYDQDESTLKMFAALRIERESQLESKS